MPKRKRACLDEVSFDNETLQHDQFDQALRIQASRLEAKFAQGVKQVHCALKLARGFERQKLGRRQKTIDVKVKEQGTNAGAQRLAAEIGVLKSLDLMHLAVQYLWKQCTKTKRINESIVFQRMKPPRAAANIPGSSPAANVTARLFNSNPVKKIVPTILEDVRSILGIPKDGGKTKEAQAQPLGPPGARAAGATTDNHCEKPSEGFSEDELSEDTEARVDTHNIASSSGADSADEGLLSQLKLRLAPPPISGFEPDSDSEGISESTSESMSAFSHDSTSLSLKGAPIDKEEKSRHKTKASSTTTFLPSLSMGGYWSGSESDVSDKPDDSVTRIQPRKNRMGQQARRALWEKKFGGGANHVKNRYAESGQSRDIGWDVQRGATDSFKAHEKPGAHSKGGRQQHSGKSHREKTSRTGANSDPLGSRGQASDVQDKRPLHPSWEAARRAKKQTANAAFEGKKVIFD